MATTQTIETIETTAAEFPSTMAIALRTAQTVELQSPAEIEHAMQQFDGEQFMADVMGQALEKWFYSFSIGGKKVEGVSAKGAHEFARLRAEQGFPIRFPVDGIHVAETTENGETGIRAMVIARDYRTGLEAIGMAFYPYFIEKRDGTKEFDRMASRKALSVAERNGILRLIPEKQIISALKARATIIADNAKTLEQENRAALSRRPEARRVTAGTKAQASPTTNAYDEIDTNQTQSAASKFVMPFGQQRGKPLGEIDNKALLGAVDWAEGQGRFAEFVSAAKELMEERRLVAEG